MTSALQSLRADSSAAGGFRSPDWTRPSVRIRPMEAGETRTVLAVFDGLSPDRRQARFLTPMPTMPPAMLRRLASPDGRDHVAMVATAHGRPVGIGRYVRMLDGAADVAGAVVDDWSGCGVANQLLQALREHAEDHGVECFVFSMAADNHLVVGALRRRGAAFSRPAGTVMEARMDLARTP